VADYTAKPFNIARKPHVTAVRSVKTHPRLLRLKTNLDTYLILNGNQP
jgi:hypothetical protein